MTLPWNIYTWYKENILYEFIWVSFFGGGIKLFLNPHVEMQITLSLSNWELKGLDRIVSQEKNICCLRFASLLFAHNVMCFASVCE